MAEVGTHGRKDTRAPGVDTTDWERLIGGALAVKA